MRRPLFLAVVLACVLLTGGCVFVPPGGPPPVPRRDATVARASSPPASATQAPARTALVATTPVRKTAKRHAESHALQRRSPGATGRERSHRMPQARQPHRAVPSAPTRPVAPRTRHRGAAPKAPGHRSTRPRTARPSSAYDLRTVCGWAHQVPAPSGAATLCDSLVR
ncbi:hypothetical protein PYK79_52580 [Streptomyces sp. ID05-04B]|uniref:hypothetical protein n=1 Tax=unclassified Streptomyces TaxID=2593676 RepID=UPI000D1B66D0|nr:MULTISPECIES: hypothetical protein [unclassified Streptomyces]AVV47179.1 hypothetical protein C6376_43545 [Streptomyces sp. P3]MDX5570210.1 hypothetical protein [Streptomyces sp. ID05-04B]